MERFCRLVLRWLPLLVGVIAAARTTQIVVRPAMGPWQESRWVWRLNPPKRLFLSPGDLFAQVSATRQLVSPKGATKQRRPYPIQRHRLTQPLVVWMRSDEVKALLVKTGIGPTETVEEVRQRLALQGEAVCAVCTGPFHCNDWAFTPVGRNLIEGRWQVVGPLYDRPYLLIDPSGATYFKDHWGNAEALLESKLWHEADWTVIELGMCLLSQPKPSGQMTKAWCLQRRERFAIGQMGDRQGHPLVVVVYLPRCTVYELSRWCRQLGLVRAYLPDGGSAIGRNSGWRVVFLNRHWQ